MVRITGRHASRPFGVSIGRLIRDVGGTTLPEYALIIAILAAGACVAYVAAGSQANSVLSSVSRLTNEMAGGQVGSFRDDHPMGQSEFVPTPNGHALRDSSWTAQHAAVIMGAIAWIATMAVGLLALRAHRFMSKGRQEDKTDSDIQLAEAEPSSYDRLVEKRQQIRRLVTRDVENTGSVRTRVHHLMSKQVTTVRSTTPVSTAIELMTTVGIRHLLVCDEQEQLIGIVSDRDIKNRQGEMIADIMTPNPAVAQPDGPIGPAITLMLTRNISCLPVVEQSRVCGVLTSTDVMLSCQCMLHVLENPSVSKAADASSSPIEAA